MSENRYDTVTTYVGVAHPLSGLSTEYFDVIYRILAEAEKNGVDLADHDERESLADAILRRLRAAKLLNAAPRFAKVHNGRHHWVRDEESGQNVVKTLFGVGSISSERAQWVADQLNNGDAVTPQAWARHQEKIKEGAG